MEAAIIQLTHGTMQLIFTVSTICTVHDTAVLRDGKCFIILIASVNVIANAS